MPNDITRQETGGEKCGTINLLTNRYWKTTFRFSFINYGQIILEKSYNFFAASWLLVECIVRNTARYNNQYNLVKITHWSWYEGTSVMKNNAFEVMQHYQNDKLVSIIALVGGVIII